MYNQFIHYFIHIEVYVDTSLLVEKAKQDIYWVYPYIQIHKIDSFSESFII